MSPYDIEKGDHLRIHIDFSLPLTEEMKEVFDDFISYYHGVMDKLDDTGVEPYQRAEDFIERTKDGS